MKNNKLTMSLIGSLLIVNLALPALAWRITPELKLELAEKKASVSQSPQKPAPLFDLAITYGYTNHLLDGMATLKKVNDLDPNYKKQALTLYINKVTENPGDWRLRFRLAFAYYFNGMHKDAIREFNNVLKIDPYNVWAYGYLALIYGETGDINNAIAITKDGLKIDNNVAALHLLLAEGYIKKGNNWGGFLERMEAVRLRALGY